MATKPFYPMQALVHADEYLGQLPQDRGIMDARWYITNARSKLEIAILKQMIQRSRERDQRKAAWQRQKRIQS